jgi:hypothetical protein
MELRINKKTGKPAMHITKIRRFAIVSVGVVLLNRVDKLTYKAANNSINGSTKRGSGILCGLVKIRSSTSAVYKLTETIIFRNLCTIPFTINNFRTYSKAGPAAQNTPYSLVHQKCTTLFV